MKKKVENFKLEDILVNKELILGGAKEECAVKSTWYNGENAGTDTRYYLPTYGNGHTAPKTDIVDEVKGSYIYDNFSSVKQKTL